MLEKIMRKYAMSREGAKGFINAVCACTVSDIVLMFPVGLLYYLTGDMLNGTVNSGKIIFYAVGILLSLILIYISQFWQYNATFFSTYKESGVRRITFAETLRKLPLSFFGKKDLRDLTTTILNDCTVIEHTFSHQAAQYYGFGGEDISKIDPETLMHYYSIVFQDVTLFNNTIMENIRIGKKDATDEEVLKAAKLANELRKQNGVYSKMLHLQSEAQNNTIL